jgi:glucosylceramidase
MTGSTARRGRRRSTRRPSRHTRSGLAFLTALSCLIVGTNTGTPAHATGSAEVWLTDLDNNVKLVHTGSVAMTAGTSTAASTINLDAATTYQDIVGFGASWTDSSAWLAHDRLTAAEKNSLLTALFSQSDGIGMTLLRQPMGASDFTVSGPYTYDDQLPGMTDHGLAHFSIAHDNSYIIPILQQSLALSPSLTVLAVPWTPPSWMKSGGNWTAMAGGTLNADSYADWAQYFVKFIQAYAAAGIPVDYVMPQNEPTNPTFIPGMTMDASQEADLVKNHLGPALAAAGLSTKILGFEFAWDNLDYPRTLLNDPGAASYLAGTSWHCYGGTPDSMTTIHNEYPTKDNFMTECTGTLVNFHTTDQFATDVNLLINSTRNWARGVTMWNIALDQTGGPSQGCAVCSGLVEMQVWLDPTTGAWTHWAPTAEYWAMGQMSKFVRPGAVRLATNVPAAGINNVAFHNTDGSTVLVAVNNSSSAQTFAAQKGSEWTSYTLNAHAAATFVWS